MKESFDDWLDRMIHTDVSKIDDLLSFCKDMRQEVEFDICKLEVEDFLRNGPKGKEPIT